MISEFPNVQRWFDVIATREHGLALVLLLVVTVAGLLVNARFLYPHLLPLVRRAVVIIFYVSFALVMVASL